jgi:CelD/BcsL family acetyltransferase involved in cellulose biosynthesis
MPAAPPSARRGASVIVVERPEALEPHVAAWNDLAAAALEPNVFYEPWMLLPAMRDFGGGRDLRVALVYLGATAGSPGRLCGVFPLERLERYRNLPISALALWKHDYCYLCTPLLRATDARETLAAFLDWTLAAPADWSLLELGQVGGDGPFQELLERDLARRGCRSAVSEKFSRALFRPGAGGDAYLRLGLSRRRRKEYKRQSNRLRELGRLECLDLNGSGDAEAWIKRFLALEASGWKGRKGSALASRSASRRYFRSVALEGFRRGRLMMLGLFLDRRACALKCNFLARPGAFAFKIAYDEAYHRYSPGLQLEIETIARLHERPDIRWMDSCAAEEHAMINRLWADRRTIRTTLISTGSLAGSLGLTIQAARRWLRLRFGGRHRHPPSRLPSGAAEPGR